MSAIYNGIDRGAAQWMRELIKGGHISDGVVDERSIADLRADDVAGPGARHFFAGIGGWSYALRLAGVPDTADVWTGSCPCQPFSSAGRGLGRCHLKHPAPTKPDRCVGCGCDLRERTLVLTQDGGARRCSVCWCKERM